MAAAARPARAIAWTIAQTIPLPRLDLIEKIDQVGRQISRAQVRGSFWSAVAGPHVSDRKCKPRTTVGGGANQRIHMREAGG